jgi:hypothetical protein
MKKVYFTLNPLGPIYYKYVADDEGRVCVGWDGHRNEYVGFYENYEDLKKVLEKNKQYFVSKKYEELLKLIDIEFEEKDALKFRL